MAGGRKSDVELVQYGGAVARITQRGNGLWVVRWREARVGRQTTASTRTRARELAKKKVRELAAGSGSRLVTATEASTLDRLRSIIGTRSLSAVVEQLEDSVHRLGGWPHLTRAVEAYIKAGHGRVESKPLQEAVPQFLLSHEKRSASIYLAGLRKELEAGMKAYSEVAVCDLDEALLRGWISRPNEDGAEPGARYYNNRLATWKTFLNWARSQNLVMRSEPHPAELIKPKRLEDKAPEIWTPEQASKALRVVQEHAPQCLPYLVIGCWLGLRPFEMRRLRWDAWDWERGYVDVGARVALKVMRQRFVPIPDNVRALLHGLHEDPRWGVKVRRKAKACTRVNDQKHLAEVLRKHGVIDEWPQDVMRHSYISYRLAQGNGRGQVAEWAGNSESEIRKSYRRPLRKEDGNAWFAIGLPVATKRKPKSPAPR
jgi:integrase